MSYVLDYIIDKYLYIPLYKIPSNMFAFIARCGYITCRLILLLHRRSYMSCHEFENCAEQMYEYEMEQEEMFKAQVTDEQEQNELIKFDVGDIIKDDSGLVGKVLDVDYCQLTYKIKIIGPNNSPEVGDVDNHSWTDVVGCELLDHYTEEDDVNIKFDNEEIERIWDITRNMSKGGS